MACARATTHTPYMDNLKTTFKIPKLSIKYTFEQINVITIQYAMFIILHKWRIVMNEIVTFINHHNGCISSRKDVLAAVNVFHSWKVTRVTSYVM